jgi:hypothetical protein
LSGDGITNNSTSGNFNQKSLIRLAIPTLFWFKLAADLKLLKGNSPADLIVESLTGKIFTGAYYAGWTMHTDK